MDRTGLRHEGAYLVNTQSGWEVGGLLGAFWLSVGGPLDPWVCLCRSPAMPLGASPSAVLSGTIEKATPPYLGLRKFGQVGSLC